MKTTCGGFYARTCNVVFTRSFPVWLRTSWRYQGPGVDRVNAKAWENKSLNVDIFYSQPEPGTVVKSGHQKSSSALLTMTASPDLIVNEGYSLVAESAPLSSISAKKCIIQLSVGWDRTAHSTRRINPSVELNHRVHEADCPFHGRHGPIVLNSYQKFIILPKIYNVRQPRWLCNLSWYTKRTFHLFSSVFISMCGYRKNDKK